MKARFIIATAALALCGAAFGQSANLIQLPPTSTVIYPTTGDGPDQIAKGAESAYVTQTINLTLPKATALHLDVSTLNFDLTPLDGADWATRAKTGAAVNLGNQMTCVYGLAPDDVTFETNSDFYNQKVTLPLGTYYTDAGWPKVNIIGGPTVNTYPPIRLDANGQLIEGSKGYFVCYRTFILQKFSNGLAWDLTATRTDAPGARAIQHLYIQDNPCYSFGANTGFYRLGHADDYAKGIYKTVHLVPKSLGVGPTGLMAQQNPAACGVKSWLDDLVVVAVRVNSDLWGQNTATVQYTLSTTAW